MARNNKSEFVTIGEINPIIKGADMVKNNTKDNTSTDDIVELAFKTKERYIDKKGRLSVYIDNDILTDFKEIAGVRMQSEIVERLLKRFVADVKAKKNNMLDIPE